jgi:hypothetical protein
MIKIRKTHPSWNPEVDELMKYLSRGEVQYQKFGDFIVFTFNNPEDELAYRLKYEHTI